MILEMGGIKDGEAKAKEILESGQALAKFREIVAAQGGNPNISSSDIVIGKYQYDIVSAMSGYVNSIKNKQLVQIARAAGSPKDKGAGIVLNKKRGNRVLEGETLYTIYADHEAKLEQAIGLARKLDPMVVENMIISKLPNSSKYAIIEETQCNNPDGCN